MLAYKTLLTLLFALLSVFPLLPISPLSPKPTLAADFQSDEFRLQTGVSPIPTPRPPFEPFVQTDFARKDQNPLQLFVSLDLIDYGPITPTNPIKRNIMITSKGPLIFLYENHPLELEANIFPDTTCDDGTCTEKRKSVWINPFTFGLGFSHNDNDYQQFADASKNESWVAIDPGNLTIKLNSSQTQPLPEKKYYENTLVIVAIPKL